MLALSHQCHARPSTSLIRASHQSNHSSLSMNMTEAAGAASPPSANLPEAGDEWAKPSDNMKLDRGACRRPELMDDASALAARRGTLELDKLAAGSIFKSLPSETEQQPVGVGKGQQHHRQPSSDIFLRMNGDNQHNHQAPRRRRRQQQHHNKHNNHLPFDAIARSAPTSAACWMMSARKTRLIEKAAASGRRSLVKSWWPSLKIPSRSSNSLLLAFISHIVIISLILHQSPSNNQVSAWSASHQHHEWQQQQLLKHPHRDTPRQADPSTEQHYTKSDAFGSLTANSAGGPREVAPHYDDDDDDLSTKDGSIFDRMIFDEAADNGYERQRRHLASGVSWNSHRAVHKRQQQHMAETDCHKLTVFWAFLQTSYPALSSHLFQWATEMDGRSASDEQFLWSKSHGSAHSIGHLLDEAERLVAAQQRPHSTPNSAWLQRISSNPAYARLVQHLRNSVNRLHKATTSGTTTTTTTTTTTNTPPSLLSDERVAVELTGSDGPQADVGEQMSVEPTQLHSQEEHYGRVLHYPHEIGNADNSNGMARTLEKLHVLRQHTRQQERQFQQQQQQQDNEPLNLFDIESNRILSAQQDVDSRHQPHTPRQSDRDSVDSARKDVVYGRVMLKPQHANDVSSEPRRDSLSTLRHIASEQQRQLLGTKGVKMSESPRSMGAHTPEQYGRIITSPPSSSENNDRPRTRASHDNSNQQQQQQQHPSNHEPLDELNNRMTDYSQRSLAGLGSDELSNQQKSHRVAINGEQENDEDFEGIFHLGPIKEIEVRQLRSIVDHKKQQNGRPDVELVTTTSPDTVITSTAKH